MTPPDDTALLSDPGAPLVIATRRPDGGCTLHGRSPLRLTASESQRAADFLNARACIRRYPKAPSCAE